VSEAVTSEAIVRRDAIRSDRRHPVVAIAKAGSAAPTTMEAIVQNDVVRGGRPCAVVAIGRSVIVIAEAPG
jgi:hypothetical protein